MNKNELLELIQYHDDMYYNLDNPEITDAAYDELVKKFLSLGGSFDDIAKGQASSKFEKVKHVYDVKSLDKIHTEAEVRAALIRFAPGVIQLKLDGITMVVYGRDVLAKTPVWATKGNGTDEGEKVNHTAMRIPNLNSIKDVVYRAEVFMTTSEFKRINIKRVAAGLEPHKNPRNAAAGMIRNLDESKVEGLTYMAYNVMGSSAPETVQLGLLEHNGLNIVPSISYTKDEIEECVEYIMGFNENMRSELDFEIDGLVIKSDMIDSQNVFGQTGHHYKNAVAFKFPSTGEWTKLNRVVWQIGRTGQVSPVAEFEPVEILGSTVSRATLHNYGIITELGLTDNCEILVVKANDVIPKVIEVRLATGTAIPEPTTCPICNGVLNRDGANVFCLNEGCKAGIIAKTVHMAKKEALNIEDLSVKTIEKMFEAGFLEEPYDLFNITVENLLLLEGFAQKSALSMYKNIQDARIAPLHKFIYAAAIPLIGRTASKDIANKLLAFQDVLNDVIDDCKIIKGIAGIGPEMTKSLTLNFRLLTNLFFYVKPTDALKPVIKNEEGQKYTFVITGKLDNARSYYENLAKEYGHKVASAVSASTDYLVNNDRESSSSKNVKAKSLNIPIIGEFNFVGLIYGRELVEE